MLSLVVVALLKVFDEMDHPTDACLISKIQMNGVDNNPKFSPLGSSQSFRDLPWNLLSHKLQIFAQL
jgi:hypothetical protein